MLARDIAVSQVITISPDEPLTAVLKKLSNRGLEEIPVVDLEQPRQVLFMLSRRSVLARYASELEKTKEAYAEA